MYNCVNICTNRRTRIWLAIEILTCDRYFLIDVQTGRSALRFVEIFLELCSVLDAFTSPLLVYTELLMVKPLPTQPITYYDILGVEWSASVEDVRKAYKKNVLEAHPDKLDQTATEGDRRRAEKRFRDIREAFDILGDPLKRKASTSTKRHEYDARLRLLNRNDSKYSEYLKTCLRDREEWARKRQEEASRSQELQKRYPTTYTPLTDQNVVPSEVQEIVDAINVALDQVRPGWLERVRRAQEIKARFQSQQAGRV
ncbi:hypothetical protein H0H93_010971 [Arthromyces matolae]|nr:hypothetical protein H0H93_010971 [Arthromyces matolae]